MPAVSADYRKILELGASLIAALLVVTAMKAPAQAQTTHMIVIPASDGYGYDDCLAAGNKSCGQVIADAWCEAHGLSASVSFGRADDITASMPKTSAETSSAAPEPQKIEPGAFVVNCKD